MGHEPHEFLNSNYLFLLLFVFLLYVKIIFIIVFIKKLIFKVTFIIINIIIISKIIFISILLLLGRHRRPYIVFRNYVNVWLLVCYFVYIYIF